MCKALNPDSELSRFLQLFECIVPNLSVVPGVQKNLMAWYLPTEFYTHNWHQMRFSTTKVFPKYPVARLVNVLL